MKIVTGVAYNHSAVLTEKFEMAITERGSPVNFPIAK